MPPVTQVAEDVMNASSAWGAVLTFLGFLIVGSAVIYGSNANPSSLQDAVQVAKNAAMAQGVGWIVAGVGLALAIVGVATDLHDLKTVVPDVSAMSPAVRTPSDRKASTTEPAFARTDCGGDISKEDRVCPHCGAAIEGD
jgi:hypothetical protein